MQKLKGKTTKIILALTAILLVMGVVCGVVFNYKSQQVSKESPYKVELLDITENVEEDEEKEIQENGMDSEEVNETISKEVSQIAGKELVKNGVLVNGKNFASKNQKIRFQLDAKDNDMLESVSLDADDIVVKVNNTVVSATKSFDGEPTELNDGKNGKRYILVLENLEGNGQLKFTIPANNLTDESGNKSIETETATSIYIDNIAPTISSASEFSGSSISFTAIDIGPDGNNDPSGVTGYKLTDNNIAPSDGWTDVTVPAATTVNSKKQTSSSITVSSTNLKAGPHYIWITDAVGNKTSKQIKIKYTITLDNQGATSPGTTDFSASDTTLPKINVPTKTGYTFGGYYTVEDGKGLQYYDADGNAIRSNNFNQNTTLYAKWTVNNYSISFNKNAKSVFGTMEDQKINYGVTQSLAKNKYVRIGYVFNGWNTAEDGSGTPYNDGANVTSLSSTADGNVTLYAQWVEADATFWGGRAFTIVAKRLAGNSTAMEDTIDTAVTQIKYAEIGTEPGQITLDQLYEIRETAVTASLSITSADKYVDICESSSSNTPIYVWFDDGILYWFSEDNAPKLNKNCYKMFCGLAGLTEIEQLKVLEAGETRVANFEAQALNDIRTMFGNCKSLKSLDLTNYDVSNVSQFNDVFSQCEALESLNISNWNTSRATEMLELFDNCKSLETLDVSGFNTSNVTDMKSMFYGCESLTELDVSHFNTSKVTTMFAMFQQCDSITHLDLSHFDTSKVTTMRGMFYNCDKLTELDLRSFNTSRVQSMYFMFASCSNLERIYAKDTFVTTALNNNQIEGKDSGHTNSTYIFNGCSKLVGGSGTQFSTAHLNSDYARIDGKGAPGYFTDHYFIEFNPNTTQANGTMEVQGIPFGYNTQLNSNQYTKTNSAFIKWNTKSDGSGLNLTDGQNLNYSLSQIRTIAPNATDDRKITIPIYAQWNENARAMFKTGKEVNAIMKELSGSRGANYGTKNTNILHIARSTTMTSDQQNSAQIVSVTKTGSINADIYMWADISTYTIYWYSSDDDPELNTDSSNMFYEIQKVQDITGLDKIDTHSATTMEAMFGNCNTLTSLNLSRFDTQNVTNMKEMFKGMTNLTGLTFGNSFDTSNVTDMTSMFQDCTSLASINFGDSFNTLSVVNFESMFQNSGLTSLDLSNFDTSSATNMKQMFAYDSSLTNITFGENFTASNVESFYGMFGACSGLTVLDLLNFNTSSATNTVGMFNGCSSLSTIYASDSFNTDSVTSSSNMFYGCTSLVGGNGTIYNEKSTDVDKSRAVIDGKGGPGYFTNHFFVEFEKNSSGVTGTMERQAIPFNYDMATLRTNVYEKEGYTLIGWNTVPYGFGTSFSNGQNMNYSLEEIKPIAQYRDDDKNIRLILYAQWADNSYQNTNTNKYYSTLKSALAEAQNGETIKVNNSKAEPENSEPTVDAGKSVTLDLNGKTVTLSKKINNNGTLTIKTSESGGTLQNLIQGYVTIRNNEDATLNLNGGTILGERSVVVENYGTISITGSPEIKGQNSTYPTVDNYGRISMYGGNIHSVQNYGIKNNVNSSFNISNGSVTNVYNEGSVFINNPGSIGSVRNKNILNIYGGTIETSGDYGVIQDGDKATINMLGGSIKGKTGIYANGKSTITVRGSNSSIEGITYEGILGLYSKIVIVGGNIIGKTDGITASSNGDYIGSIEMTGGTVSGTANGIHLFSNAELTMGTNNGLISTTTPSVISNASSGTFYGLCLDTNSVLNFYDGKITGLAGKSINYAETDKPDGYQVIKTTTDGKETATLGKEVIVTADANGGNILATDGWEGTGSSAIKTCIKNNAYGTLPTLEDRYGYSFSGWKINGEGDMVYSNFQVTRDESHTLVAKWIPKDTAITFVPNGGVWENGHNLIAYYGQEMPEITFEPPTREGYIFDGWYDQNLSVKYYNADGTSARVWNQVSTSMLLFAKWIPQ